MAVKLLELGMAGALMVVISIGDDAANYRAAGKLPLGGGGGEGRQEKRSEQGMARSLSLLAALWGPERRAQPAGEAVGMLAWMGEAMAQLLRKKINRTPSDEECFFDLLSKFQSNRMDDQRCPLEECPGEAAEAAATRVPALAERISQSTLMASPQTEEFFDLIASSQSRRLDDQRANVGNLPGLRITHNNLGHLRVEGDAQEPGDEFFNMLMKCQSSRIDDQRCAPPDSIPRGPTMPDEDFFSLIQRVQAKRMDEQRVDLASAQEEAEEEQQRPGSS
ncbi:G-protein-signaling modulator 1 isoform X2 [Lonchura striata]